MNGFFQFLWGNRGEIGRHRGISDPWGYPKKGSRDSYSRPRPSRDSMSWKSVALKKNIFCDAVVLIAKKYYSNCIIQSEFAVMQLKKIYKSQTKPL
jgi:hypothetical protein